MTQLSDYFYNNTTTLYNQVFGSVFSKIKIKRKKGQVIEVPISFASGQKTNMIADATESKETVRSKIPVPRMTYELVNMTRDTTRQLNKNHKITNGNVENGSVSYQWNRVPFNFEYRLDIKTQYYDDMLQIIEQILVAFAPNVTVSVKDNSPLDGFSGIQISLTSNTLLDEFEGMIETDRILEFSLTFSLEGYLYKKTHTGSVITNVILEYNDLDSGIELEVTNIPGIPVDSPPKARMVTITFNEDEKKLIADYHYFSLDENPESGSLYQWYVSSDSLGSDSEAIEGGNQTVYSLTEDDMNQYFSFGVTPSDGSLFGDEYKSNWFLYEEEPIDPEEPVGEEMVLRVGEDSVAFGGVPIYGYLDYVGMSAGSITPSATIGGYPIVLMVTADAIGMLQLAIDVGSDVVYQNFIDVMTDTTNNIVLPSSESTFQMSGTLAVWVWETVLPWEADQDISLVTVLGDNEDVPIEPVDDHPGYLFTHVLTTDGEEFSFGDTLQSYVGYGANPSVVNGDYFVTYDNYVGRYSKSVDGGTTFGNIVTTSNAFPSTKIGSPFADNGNVVIGRPSQAGDYPYREITYSLDNGVTFQTDQGMVSTQQNGLAFGNGVYVSIATTGIGTTTYPTAIVDSPISYAEEDVFSFNPIRLPEEEFGAVFRDVKFLNGKFFVIGTRNTTSTDNRIIIKTSTDGKNWTTQNTDNNVIPSSIEYGNGVYVISGGDRRHTVTGMQGKTLVSADGEVWTEHDVDVTNTGLGALVFGNGIFAAKNYWSSDTYLYYSTNGINWQRIKLDTVAVNYPCFGNGVFVVTTQAAGGVRTMRYSTDCETWTAVTGAPWTSTTLGIHILFDGSRFVTHYTNAAYESIDGEEWTEIPNIETYSLPGWNNKMYYANGIYSKMTGISTQKIATTNLSETWKSARSLSTSDIIQAGNGRFVRLRAFGYVTSTETLFNKEHFSEYSDDGFNWKFSTTVIEPCYTSNSPVLGYIDGRFVSGGISGTDPKLTIGVSSDGDNWNIYKFASSNMKKLIDVAIKDSVIMIVVEDDLFEQRFYTSDDDGITWEENTSLSVNKVVGLESFQNKFYVLCEQDDSESPTGVSTYLYSSLDGITWEQKLYFQKQTTGLESLGLAHNGNDSLLVMGVWY